MKYITFILIVVQFLSSCRDVKSDSGNLENATSYRTDYDYNKFIVWKIIADKGYETKNFKSIHYHDVMSRTDSPWLAEDHREEGQLLGPDTESHESMHVLAGEVSTSQISGCGQFIYFAGNKGSCITKEPKLSEQLISNYVSDKFKRTFHYNLYITEVVFPGIYQQFDEWNAFAVDERVSVEVFKAKTFDWHSHGTEVVYSGALSAFYLCSAAVLAIKEHEPSYLVNNEEFKSAFAMLAEKTMQYLPATIQMEKELGSSPEVFADTKDLLDHILTDQENGRIRQTLRDWFGDDWMKRVLGI